MERVSSLQTLEETIILQENNNFREYILYEKENVSRLKYQTPRLLTQWTSGTIWNERKIQRENSTIYREPNLNYMHSVYSNFSYPGVENYTRYATARHGLRPLAVKQLKLEFGPVINDVLSFQYPLSIPSCRETLMKKSVFVAVISATENFNRRKMIRQTWYNHLKTLRQEELVDLAGFAFILGITKDEITQIKIQEESKTWGDIIQIEFTDIYENLTYKVAALLNWFYRFCGSVDFVLKVDDDVYVNVDILAHFVKLYNESNYIMFGSSPNQNITNRSN